MRSILITNDDGIDADGLIRLARAASAFGEVWVVAPASQRSAASHSISLHSPIDVTPYEFPVAGVHAFSCSGTPADCVRIGSLNLVPQRPDAVLSGINYGYNVASDIQYSATAGAAFEAAFQGLHAIAFSESACPQHDTTDAYLRTLLAELLDTPLAAGQIHNVNFPQCALSECRGILRNRTVSTGMIYRDHYNVIEQLPNSGQRLMVEGTWCDEAEPDTDLRAIYDNYVSVGTVNNIG